MSKKFLIQHCKNTRLHTCHLPISGWQDRCLQVGRLVLLVVYFQPGCWPPGNPVKKQVVDLVVNLVVDTACPWPGSGVDPTILFFLCKCIHNISVFSIKLGHFMVIHLFHLLQTLKLNNKNLKMRKTKFGRIDSWTGKCQPQGASRLQWVCFQWNISFGWTWFRH